MKDKRYFCDWLKQPMSSQLTKAILSSFIILTVLASIVLYNLDVKYGEEIAEYSEEVYANLEEIADGVIEKNIINLDAIQDGVSNYEVTYKNGVLTFKCSADHYEGKTLFPSAKITVTESSGVVKKERNISSKEEYIKFQKRGRIVGNVASGIFICVILYAVIFAVLVVQYIISCIHKLIDTIKKPS